MGRLGPGNLPHVHLATVWISRCLMRRAEPGLGPAPHRTSVNLPSHTLHLSQCPLENKEEKLEAELLSQETTHKGAKIRGC